MPFVCAALGEKGIKFREVVIPTKPVPDWFKNLNPKGETPVIRFNGKVRSGFLEPFSVQRACAHGTCLHAFQVVVDSGNILQLLERAHPNPSLLTSEAGLSFEDALSREMKRVDALTPLLKACTWQAAVVVAALCC